MSGHKIKHGFDGRSSTARCLEKAVKLLTEKLHAKSFHSVYELREECFLALDGTPSEDYQKARMIVCLLVDICLQGWTCRIAEGRAIILEKAAVSEDQYVRKTIQGGLLVQRDEQLRQDSVRGFVKEMEQSRLTASGWFSVFDLMKDGRELAKELALSNDHAPFEPYLQFVDPISVCEHTGLRLMDIWRYFRLTWSLEYKTVPGRNLAFLIRDKASSNHPIMGIIALASPVMNLSERDRWVGWSTNELVEKIRAKPNARWGHWLLEGIEELIRDTYHDDLLDKKIISTKSLESPSSDDIDALEKAAKEFKAQHDRHPQKQLLKAPDPDKIDDVDWRARALSHLYGSKRCLALIDAMKMKMTVIRHGLERPTISSVRAFADSSDGARAFDILRKYKKAIHAGNDMLDITVCGAVAPYNLLHGGKLVAMLATAPQVSKQYLRRYAGRPSIIASSMAGRPIVRKIKLPLLTTTSLYGVEPNQYTRVRVPGTNKKYLGEIRYERVGKTAGTGTFHYSQESTKEIDAFLRIEGGPKVNSIFGEGQSPRLRKLRMGLDAGGFPSDILLSHGTPRIIYGVPLALNFREVLLEYDKRIHYIHAQSNDNLVNRKITDHWWDRWAKKKAMDNEVIEKMLGHTQIHPITHGARVNLPRIPTSQTCLFDDDLA